MPERILTINDPLAAAIPRGSDDHVIVPDDINSEVSSIDGSVHTAELYEDVSVDEGFENAEFLDEVSRLERDYFDSLHVDKAPVYSAFNRSTAPSNLHDRFLTDFERDNFHLENVNSKW